MHWQLNRNARLHIAVCVDASAAGRYIIRYSDYDTVSLRPFRSFNACVRNSEQNDRETPSVGIYCVAAPADGVAIYAFL